MPVGKCFLPSGKCYFANAKCFSATLSAFLPNGKVNKLESYTK